MPGVAQELAIHQEDIEKIELLGQACRHLKILYLQDNLIHKLGSCPSCSPLPAPRSPLTLPLRRSVCPVIHRARNLRCRFAYRHALSSTNARWYGLARGTVDWPGLGCCLRDFPRCRENPNPGALNCCREPAPPQGAGVSQHRREQRPEGATNSLSLLP